MLHFNIYLKIFYNRVLIIYYINKLKNLIYRLKLLLCRANLIDN